MRKGDEKRQALLNTAESIFCQKGYEAASIQDFLAASGMSKGGFYHHFTGKEAVMQALCERHAALARAAAQEALDRTDAPIARINAVLRAVLPLRTEELNLLRAMLPCMNRMECRSFVLTYQECLVQAFLPLLAQETDRSAQADVLHPQTDGMEHAVLHLLSRAFLDLAEYLAAVQQANASCEPAALLPILERYRRAVELLLDAPFGSIEIIRVEEIVQLVDAVREA